MSPMFIRLTLSNGMEMLVNIKAILFFSTEGTGSEVTLEGNVTHLVIESPDDIESLILQERDYWITEGK